MFYLILAIVSSAMVSIIMRLSNDKVRDNMAMLTVSYITSTGIAALHTGGGSFSLSQPGLWAAAAMAVVNGFLYVYCFVLMQKNIIKSGVVLTSTYMRLGLIVCMALSVFLFGEMPQPLQLLGFCLAVGAILLNAGKPQADGRSFSPGLLLILAMSGLTDTWVKVFGTFLAGSLSDEFLLITFVVCALLCLVMMLYKKQRIGLWELTFGAAIAIPNYYNSRFLLKALQTVPGIIVYPSFNVATLLLITLLGVWLLKERLSRRQWLSMGIILVALALLNL